MQIKYGPSKGATHRKKRVGCGPGSGHGKTSCRGHKGAGARSGKEYDARFEGGQMPLYRKIPKRGFTNPNRITYQVVNFADLEKARLSGTINFETLKKAGLVSKSLPVKILGKGKISAPITLQVDAISKSALQQLQAAGGKFQKTQN